MLNFIKNSMSLNLTQKLLKQAFVLAMVATIPSLSFAAKESASDSTETAQEVLCDVPQCHTRRNPANCPTLRDAALITRLRTFIAPAKGTDFNPADMSSLGSIVIGTATMTNFFRLHPEKLTLAHLACCCQSGMQFKASDSDREVLFDFLLSLPQEMVRIELKPLLWSSAGTVAFRAGDEVQVRCHVGIPASYMSRDNEPAASIGFSPEHLQVLSNLFSDHKMRSDLTALPDQYDENAYFYIMINSSLTRIWNYCLTVASYDQSALPLITEIYEYLARIVTLNNGLIHSALGRQIEHSLINFESVFQSPHTQAAKDFNLQVHCARFTAAELHKISTTDLQKCHTWLQKGGDYIAHCVREQFLVELKHITDEDQKLLGKILNSFELILSRAHCSGGQDTNLYASFASHAFDSINSLQKLALIREKLLDANVPTNAGSPRQYMALQKALARAIKEDTTPKSTFNAGVVAKIRRKEGCTLAAERDPASAQKVADELLEAEEKEAKKAAQKAATKTKDKAKKPTEGAATAKATKKPAFPLPAYALKAGVFAEIYAEIGHGFTARYQLYRLYESGELKITDPQNVPNGAVIMKIGNAKSAINNAERALMTKNQAVVGQLGAAAVTGKITAVASPSKKAGKKPSGATAARARASSPEFPALLFPDNGTRLMAHIGQPSLERSGFEGTGWHHDPERNLQKICRAGGRGRVSGTLISIDRESCPEVVDAQKAYAAYWRSEDAAATSWKLSTFFPQAWSAEQVEQCIRQAAQRLNLLVEQRAEGLTLYHGHADGLAIEFLTKRDEASGEVVVLSAYPVLELI